MLYKKVPVLRPADSCRYENPKATKELCLAHDIPITCSHVSEPLPNRKNMFVLSFMPSIKPHIVVGSIIINTMIVINAFNDL